MAPGTRAGRPCVPEDAAIDLLEAAGLVLGELLGHAGRVEVLVEAADDLTLAIDYDASACSRTRCGSGAQDRLHWIIPLSGTDSTS